MAGQEGLIPALWEIGLWRIGLHRGPCSRLASLLLENAKTRDQQGLPLRHGKCPSGVVPPVSTSEKPWYGLAEAKGGRGRTLTESM